MSLLSSILTRGGQLARSVPNVGVQSLVGVRSYHEKVRIGVFLFQ